MEKSVHSARVFTYKTQTHFDDLDGLWVLHHSRYLVFLERAVIALFDQAMNTERFDPEKYPDLYQVVRDVQIRYLRPIDGVYPFVVALAVERVREAGLQLRFAFCDETGSTVYARGVRVSCKMSRNTKAPTGWTEAFRQAYEPLVVRPEALPERWREALWG